MLRPSLSHAFLSFFFGWCNVQGDELNPPRLLAESREHAMYGIIDVSFKGRGKGRGKGRCRPLNLHFGEAKRKRLLDLLES